MKPETRGLFFLFVVFSVLGLDDARGQTIHVIADKPDGIYRIGESVRWTVSVDDKALVDTTIHYSIEPGQGKASASGTLNLSKTNEAGVEFKFTAPSAVLLKVTGTSATGKPVVAFGGAIADPYNIAASSPAPADFDAFWAAKVKELDTVPVNARSSKVESGKPGVLYESLLMDNIRHATTHAQLARPGAGEKFPAILLVQYAGVYGLNKAWVTDRAKDGWLALDVMPHDLPIDQPPDYYKTQFEGPLKNYWAIGNDDRETSYFLKMYLSCYRAVEYLRSRPDWDGKTLVVMGGSQGGQQSLMIAGLSSDITAAMANVPAGCDMLGSTIGRKGGWPQWYDWTPGKDAEKVHETSRYFDVVNFARHIKCPVLVGGGLIDQTCPASGVCAAFNQIMSPKELILMPLSGHQNENNSQAAYDKRLWTSWLPALVAGKPAPVAEVH